MTTAIGVAPPSFPASPSSFPPTSGRPTPATPSTNSNPWQPEAPLASPNIEVPYASPGSADSHSEFRLPCRRLHRPRSGRRSCKRSSKRRPSHPWAPVGCRSCRHRPPLRLQRPLWLLLPRRSSPKLRPWRRRADSLHSRRLIAERYGRSRLVQEVAGPGPSSPGSPWWHRRQWSPRSFLGIERPCRNRWRPRPPLRHRTARRRRRLRALRLLRSRPPRSPRRPRSHQPLPPRALLPPRRHRLRALQHDRPARRTAPSSPLQSSAATVSSWMADTRAIRPVRSRFTAGRIQ